MKRALLALLLLGLTMTQAHAAAPRVLLETTQGNITLELNADKAPKTVANFVQYVKDKHYDGLVFHRVIKNFMIQGGGYDASYRQRQTRTPIACESQNGLRNLRGTIAMARTSDPNSATSQFFINHVDNANLDYPSFDGYGYAVFGKVVDGLDVVDKIASAPTGATAPFGRDVPVTQVVITRASLLDDKK
jgi:cyclophilin family peptidyl-prolyl cis-trans isomerase